ncbi:glycosyltransferase, partial [candidate division WWE3 bacterium]
VCFSHMIPEFTILAAPLLKLKRIRIVTWYAHPTVTRRLQLAHHLSDRMVASLAAAYPYKHDKLTVVGQGIDTELFTPDATVPEEPPSILYAGRLSPVKDLTTLLKAAALLWSKRVTRFHVNIVGGPAVDDDKVYVQSLHTQVEELGLKDTVSFWPPVPMTELPSWYRKCTVGVNLTPTGSGDKVVLEAMSCARLCLAANEGFTETMGNYAEKLLFRHGDPEDLAEKLHWVLTLTAAELKEIGAYLRKNVEEYHSLRGLAGRLISLFEELRSDVQKQEI